MTNTKQDLENRLWIKDVLATTLAAIIFISTAGYVSCAVQQGSISEANKYISEQFREGYEKLNHAPTYALTP
jgi:hypothetical protein